MFETITNFFSGVKDFFQPAVDLVSGGVSRVYNSVTGALSTAHDDVVSYVGGVKDVVTHTIDGAKDVVTHTTDVVGDTVGSIGQSFALPLTLVGGAAALYLISQRR